MNQENAAKDFLNFIETYSKELSEEQKENEQAAYDALVEQAVTELEKGKSERRSYFVACQMPGERGFVAYSSIESKEMFALSMMLVSAMPRPLKQHLSMVLKQMLEKRGRD